MNDIIKALEKRFAKARAGVHRDGDWRDMEAVELARRDLNTAIKWHIRNTVTTEKKDEKAQSVPTNEMAPGLPTANEKKPRRAPKSPNEPR